MSIHAINVSKRALKKLHFKSIIKCVKVVKIDIQVIRFTMIVTHFFP